MKKRVILATIVVLIGLSILTLVLNKTDKISKTVEEEAKAQYISTIGNETFDITNAVTINANVPTVTAGMIPVKFDGNYWQITTKDDTDWYDYSNKKPAYVMLNDGVYQSEVIQNMTGKKLATENIGAQIKNNELGTIYMWIPRFAYNDIGDIVYIKQNYVVAGSWTMPEMFIYETAKKDFDFAGIWIEYNVLADDKAVTNKVNQISKEEGIYGLLANANSKELTATEQSTVQKYIANVGFLNEPIIDVTNINRTILRITNTNYVSAIKGTASYDSVAENIKIEVTYNANDILKIVDKKGNVLSNNSLIADTANEPIGNGTYTFYVIDVQGNIRKITTKISGLKVYVIPDLETLKAFRDKVNSGSTFSGYKVYQTADIVIDEVWVPIGNNKLNSSTKKYNAFSGTYDGLEHTISNLYFEKIDDLVNNLNKLEDRGDYYGLFGYVNGGTIKNLTVLGKKGEFVLGYQYVGAIAGCIDKSTVYNCFVDNITIQGHAKIGGIVGGALYESSIENCGSNAIISGYKRPSTQIGGIVGEDISGITIKKCFNTGKIVGAYYVGGIVGYGNNSKTVIDNCYNTGMIEVTYGNAGGIGGNNIFKITNCYNLGTVTTRTTVYNANLYIGGIYGGQASSKVIIKNCYNAGNVINKVDSAYRIAGIAYAGTISNCYNYGNITGAGTNISGIGGTTVTDCFNAGEVQSTKSTTSNVYVAGITCQGNVTNCYNAGDVHSLNTSNGKTIGGITALTSSVSNCYNIGNISGYREIGGIIGNQDSTTSYYINNSYNTGTVTGNTGYAGAITGYSSTATLPTMNLNYYLTGTAIYGNGRQKNNTNAESLSEANMKDGTMLTNLGEKYKEDFANNINNGLPILTWQTGNDNLNLINGDSAFIEDTNNINNGYPILAWQ